MGQQILAGFNCSERPALTLMHHVHSAVMTFARNGGYYI